MAIGKSNDQIIAGLKELIHSVPEEMAAKHSSTVATIIYRLKKLDKLEQEALARRGLAGDNMGINLEISEGRVEDEQASQKAEKRPDKPGCKRQTASKRVGAKDNARKAQ